MCQDLYSLLAGFLTGKTTTFFIMTAHILELTALWLSKILCQPVCGALASTPCIKELFLTMFINSVSVKGISLLNASVTVTQVILSIWYLGSVSSFYGSLGWAVWMQMSALWITEIKWDDSECVRLQCNLLQQIHLYFLYPEQTRENINASHLH